MEQLKILLGIPAEDAEKDELLRLVLTEAEEFILSYCRVAAVPEKLKGLVPFMAADVYRAKGYGTDTLPSDVKSVSEGSRSVSYEVKRPDDALASYRLRLNPYRRARVPSEVADIV